MMEKTTAQMYPHRLLLGLIEVMYAEYPYIDINIM